MPRISADSVAEHVASQEQAIIASAARLLVERGAAAVTMADIAADVGLARNSIYRYFPDKFHVLAAWFNQELEPVVLRSTEIANSEAPAEEKLHEWLDLQLDYLCLPEHRRMTDVMSELAEMEESLRETVSAGHVQLYRIATALIEEALQAHGASREHDPTVLTSFLSGALRSAVDLIDAGADPEVVRREAHRVAEALVAA